MTDRVLSVAVFSGTTEVSQTPLPASTSGGVLNAVAVDGGVSGRVYAVTDNLFGFFGQTGVQVFDPASVPDVTIDPPTNAHEFSVDLSGSVDPNGGAATTAQFEVSIDGKSWQPVGGVHDQSSDPGLDGGSGPVALADTATGLSQGTHYLVRLQANGPNGLARSARETFTTLTVPLPTVELDPVSGQGAETAHLTGRVNPQGFEGTARFELSTDDGNTWTPLPTHDQTTDPALADATSNVEISDDPTNLVPNTHYQVRLVATNPGGELVTVPRGFLTVPLAPVVTTALAGDRTDTTVRVGGTVDPKNSPTTWWVEYGTTTDYDQASPETKDAYVGSQNGPTDLSRKLTGLKPGTTYHYRVAAHNDGGTTNGADRTFKTPVTPPPTACPNSQYRTGLSGDLEECRAYEQVSPQDKNGIDIAFDGHIRAAPDGNSIAYQSYGGFATGGGPAAVRSQYLAARHPNNWASLNINPPYDTTLPTANPSEGGDWDFNQALTKGAAKIGQPDPTLGGTAINTLLYDTHTNTYTPITRPTTPITPNAAALVDQSLFVGASDDYQHIAIESSAALTPEAPEALDYNHAGTRPAFLFEWAPSGLRLASVLPNGDPAPGGASLGNGIRTTSGPSTAGDHAISNDGRRIYFSTHPLNDNQSTSIVKALYLQKTDLDGPLQPATTKVDTPNSGVADPGGDRPSFFQAASADGRYAFFTSSEKLTDNATASGSDACESGCDLYRFDAQAPAGSPPLTDLTTTDPAGGGAGGNPYASVGAGVVGASEDASRVFLVATGKLTPDATEGALNLYAWAEETGITYIATLTVTDIAVWSMVVGARSNGAGWTPDGTRLLFRSAARVTSYDNHGFFQLYLYDTTDNQLVCVSCNPRTDTSTGDASLKRNTNGNGISPWRLRNLTTNGHTVFFDSAEQLLPQDTNNNIDVYQWDDGHLALVSTGKATGDSVFIDATPNGDNVFFTTPDQLLPTDRDTLVDLYTARINGGQPQPPPQPTCTNNHCQDPPKPPPTLPTPATQPTDHGNATKPNPTLTIHKLTKTQRHKLTHGHTTTLTITINTPGTIRIRATTKIARQNQNHRPHHQTRHQTRHYPHHHPPHPHRTHQTNPTPPHHRPHHHLHQHPQTNPHHQTNQISNQPTAQATLELVLPRFGGHRVVRSVGC